MEQYREDRFQWRARDAAGAIIRALLSDGLNESAVRASAVAASAEDQENSSRDGGKFGQQRRIQKSKDTLALVLAELKAQKCDTSASAVAWVRRELVATYAASVVPSGPPSLASIPLGVQPALALGGDDIQRWPGTDLFACPLTMRNAQIAVAVGARRALELVRESAAAPHASTEELRDLKYCVDLKVEAYFLAVLAEQALSQVELTMIQTTMAKSGPRGSVQSSTGELPAIEDVLNQALKLFESCRDIDVPDFWRRCEAKADVPSRAGTLARLISALAVGQEEEGGTGPDLNVPPISSWWRNDRDSKLLSWIKAEGRTIDGPSLALSKSIWEKVLRAEPTTPFPSPDIFEAHSAAVRVWVLAQNRYLAVSTILHEDSAAAAFMAHPQELLKRFSEIMWGRLLRRQQVGCLAGMQRTCAQRSLLYLSTLQSEDEEFLSTDDIKSQVEEVRGDLVQTTSDSLESFFQDAQASQSVAGRARVEEGLQQCTEALREVRTSTGAFEAQAQEYHTEEPRVPCRGSVEQYAAECRGTLCALEGLKTFILSRNHS